MANENEFVQEIKFKVDDSALINAISNFRNALQGLENTLGKELPDGMKKTGKEAGNAAKETEKIGKATKTAKNEAEGLNGTFGKLAKSIKGVVAAYAGMKGIQSIVGFAKGSIDAFNVQNRAERLLEFGMRQNGTADRANELKEYASNIQGRTIYGDEAMLTAAAAWQNKIKDVDNSKRMMNLVADYAAKSTGGGAVDAGQMRGFAQQLMQALSGRGAITLRAQGFDTTAIQQLTEARNKGAVITEDMELDALEKVMSSIKGAAEELSNTDEGKIISLQNTIGDMREEIGRSLLPIVSDLANKIRENLPAIQGVFETLGGVFQDWIKTISDNIGTITSIASTIIELVGFLGKHLQWVINFKLSMTLLGPLFKKSAIEITSAENKLAMSSEQAANSMLNASAKMKQAATEANATSKKMSGLGNAIAGLKGFAMNAIVAWAGDQIEEAVSAAWQLFKQKREENKFKEEWETRTKYQNEMINAYNAFKKSKGTANGISDYTALQASVQTYRKHYGMDTAIPDYILKAIGETQGMYNPKKDEAKKAKGDTTNNYINYTNNITTDSDLMTRAIRDNLRMLLTSNLNFTSRTEAAKAILS